MCDFYTVANLLTFLTKNTYIKYLKLSKMSEMKRELSGKMPDYNCSSTRKLEQTLHLVTSHTLQSKGHHSTSVG
jgi:hypothetical protein